MTKRLVASCWWMVASFTLRTRKASIEPGHDVASIANEQNGLSPMGAPVSAGTHPHCVAVLPASQYAYDPFLHGSPCPGSAASGAMHEHEPSSFVFLMSLVFGHRICWQIFACHTATSAGGLSTARHSRRGRSCGSCGFSRQSWRKRSVLLGQPRGARPLAPG